MNTNFKQIRPEEMTDNVFSLVGKDWMLITSGTPENYNMMTCYLKIKEPNILRLKNQN